MSTGVQNRTIEFQQCVSSFDKINRKSGINNQAKPQHRPRKSQLTQQASIIAKDISHVTDLLSKLALLAKKKPMFDDNPVEINELTYVVKQEIFKIEQSIGKLRKFISGESSIQVDSQISQYSKNLLNLLNSKMKNVSGEFKNVLETRQKNEILNKSRTEQFLSAASNSMHRSNTQSPLGQMNGKKSANDNPYYFAAGTSDADTPLPYDPDRDPPTSSPYDAKEYLSIPNQTQQMLMVESQRQEYLQLRNRAVETIESTINEVGSLFQQLATMVSEQGEVIQRIDGNVEDISMNITGAQRELLRYYANITKNRWLFMKIFGVLVFFFLIWVLVS